jgi:hypothetical protein
VLAAAAKDGAQRFYECIGLIWQKLNIAYGERWLILGLLCSKEVPADAGMTILLF